MRKTACGNSYVPATFRIVDRLVLFIQARANRWSVPNPVMHPLKRHQTFTIKPNVETHYSSTLLYFSLLVDRRDDVRHFVGIDTDEYLHTSRPPPHSRSPSPWRAEDNPTLGLWSLTLLLSHPARRTPTGRRPIASQPPRGAAGASRAIPTGVLEA